MKAFFFARSHDETRMIKTVDFSLHPGKPVIGISGTSDSTLGPMTAPAP